MCVDDFESLVVLLSSIMEGQDPSGSILLGIRSVTESAGPPTSTLQSEEMGFQKQLEQIQKLRREIERLRVVLTEHYADQIANDCNVQ